MDYIFHEICSILGDAIRKTVAAHGGNRAAAARQLGISRTTLWRCLGNSKQAIRLINMIPHPYHEELLCSLPGSV